MQVRQVLKLGKEYDKCDPQVPSKGRSGLEEELETKVRAVQGSTVKYSAVRCRKVR
jgi:hypothetical protein